MRGAHAALAIALACSTGACQRERGSYRPPPDARIELVPGTAFELVRGGSAPVLKHRELGAPWMFSGATASEDSMLPGLGPLGGSAYLSGLVPPLVGVVDASVAHVLSIRAEGSVLTATLAAAGGPSLVVRLSFTSAGQSQLQIRGPAVLALPADRTDLAGFRGVSPTFSKKTSPGANPDLITLDADHLVIMARGRGRFGLDTECSPRLIVPMPRGSTSVVLLEIGPPPLVRDPIYTSTPPRKDEPSCPPTATSTLSFKGRQP